MFLKYCLTLSFILFPLSLSAYSYTNTNISWLWVQYIQYNVWSEDYKIKVAATSTATSLTSLARDYNGITGINGAFFCPADYSACWWVSHTINERFVNGEDLSFYTDTGERAIFGWDESGSPLFHQTKDLNSDDRANISEWLWNFPIIYARWKNMIEVYHDNGLYDNKMRLALPRHFICSNEDKTWIRFGRTGSTSLDNLAPVLYEMGCYNALNLDAGNSSKFLLDGQDILWSWRNILDAVVIERDGIDVFQIESNIDTIMRKLSPQFKKRSKISSIKQLEAIMARIDFLRKDIQNRHTKTLYNDEWVKTWYSREISSFKDLKQLYSLNILEKKINHLLWEIRNNI